MKYQQQPRSVDPFCVASNTAECGPSVEYYKTAQHSTVYQNNKPRHNGNESSTQVATKSTTRRELITTEPHNFSLKTVMQGVDKSSLTNFQEISRTHLTNFQ